MFLFPIVIKVYTIFCTTKFASTKILLQTLTACIPNLVKINCKTENKSILLLWHYRDTGAGSLETELYFSNWIGSEEEGTNILDGQGLLSSL